MEARFWQQKWERNDIGFHEGKVNAFLLKQLDKLELAAGSRIFLPLCGKTRDIAWLLEQGYRVAGAELSELAIQELFKDLRLEPAITRAGDMLHYGAANIDISVGDIFHLSAARLGAVDAIYDRAALVALPAAIRADYARHLRELGGRAPHLLITFEYEQSLMKGPPFSVDGDEVRRLYGMDYQVQLLEQRQVEGGLKGVPATEAAWLLRKGPEGSALT